MTTKLLITNLLLSLALLSACGSAPSQAAASAPVPGPVVAVGQPEVIDLGPTTETVWNCGEGGGTVIKHPSMSVVTSHAVEWEVGGIAGVGLTIGEGVIPGGVNLSASLEGRYTSQFDQSVQQGAAWDLPAEKNTVVVYTLMWREIWQRGYVDTRLADQSVMRVNVRYRTGIQSEIVGKRPGNCQGEQPPVAPQPAAPVQSVPPPQPEATVPPPSPTTPVSPPAIATPEPVTNVIPVWANEENGVQINISTSGVYKVAYLDGAYSPWPNEQYEGYRGWNTIVRIYVNRPVEWGRTEYGLIGPINQNDHLGPGGYYLDKSQAIATSSGDSRTFRLKAGDYLTLVALDEKGSYSDNQGKVDIGVTYLGQ